MPGKDALAPHAGTEAGVVELSASHGADVVQYLLLAFGKVASEPVLEERPDGVGQTHGGVGSEARSRFGGGRDKVRQLVIVEAGDHGSGHHPDGDAGLRERLDSGEPADGS